MGARVLILGMAVMDAVMRLEKFPSEADKHRAAGAFWALGGCGANAAVTVRRLGGESLLAARLGDDRLGRLITEDLAAEGVDCARVRRFAGCASPFSSVYVDARGERQIVNFRDPALPAGTDWLDGPSPPPAAVLADTRWPEGAQWAMEYARRAGVPGVLDAEPPLARCEGALAAAGYAVFSAEGLRDYSGGADAPAGLAAAQRRLGGFAACTAGAGGVYWRAPDGEEGRAPAFAVKARDTLAAGDVWHAAFALGLGEGMARDSALDFAGAAAALKVSRSGGTQAVPRRAEVEKFLRGRVCGDGD